MRRVSRKINSQPSRRCVSLSERCTHDLPVPFMHVTSRECVVTAVLTIDVHVSRVSVNHVTVMGRDAMGLPGEFAWFSATRLA